MALRKLLNKRKLDELTKELEKVRSEEADFLLRETEIDAREADAIKALEEMTDESTQEERQVVEQEADEIEAARAELASELEEKKSEIAELERQIRELEAELADDEPPVVSEPEQEAPVVKRSERKEENMKDFETRAQMVERLDREDVRSFYGTLMEAARDKRAVTGAELTIPEVVVDAIITKMGDYAKVKPLVRTVQLNGNGRVILDGQIPEGIWVECCDPLEELALGFTEAELNCYKVGGFVEVCNALLEDSVIALAQYVETKIAQAIAKAVDKAILSGTGSTGKQPRGIIPAVTKTASATDLAGLMAAIAQIDTGEVDLGPITAVMRRSTYYTYIQPATMLPSDAGRLVLQNANGAVLPDGTRVVFSQYAPEDEVLIGDFYSGYILGERKGITLARSEHYKFVEDNTVFKGIARYDGLPVFPDMFVLVTMAVTP